MKLQITLAMTLIVSTVFPLAMRAQSNAVYDLSHNTLAGGGNESSNAIFTIEGTVGQAAAGGTSANALYNLHGGFWSPAALAPTAASVTIAGRVDELNGGSVRRVRIVLTDSANGAMRAAQVNSFGFYRFDGVEIGRVYLLQATSKNFQFTPDTYVFTLMDARDDLNFTAVAVQ